MNAREKNSLTTYCHNDLLPWHLSHLLGPQSAGIHGMMGQLSKESPGGKTLIDSVHISTWENFNTACRTQCSCHPHRIRGRGEGSVEVYTGSLTSENTMQDSTWGTWPFGGTLGYDGGTFNP